MRFERSRAAGNIRLCFTGSFRKPHTKKDLDAFYCPVINLTTGVCLLRFHWQVPSDNEVHKRARITLRNNLKTLKMITQKLIRII